MTMSSGQATSTKYCTRHGSFSTIGTTPPAPRRVYRPEGAATLARGPRPPPRLPPRGDLYGTAWGRWDGRGEGAAARARGPARHPGRGLRLVGDSPARLLHVGPRGLAGGRRRRRPRRDLSALPLHHAGLRDDLGACRR